MAEFSKLVITKAGQALLAKMIAGTGSITFTKIATSSTAYTLAQLETLTAITNIKQTSLISKVVRTNNVAIQVEAAFTNSELKAGYYMKTLGLYAVDPDAGEILYAVTIENSGSCYMPPYNGVTVSGAYVQLITTVGNAENVSLAVDAAAVATIGDIQELEAKIADLQAYIGYTDSDIYGVEVDFTNKRITRIAGSENRTRGTGFDNVLPFGGRRRCNLTNDGKVVAYYGDSGFSTTGKLTKAVDLNPEGAEDPDPSLQFAAGTIVQTMVEQPKFYYKVVPLVLEKNKLGSKIRKARYYVSATPKTGFKLHPAFIENGKENEKIYLAAFDGSLWDASAATYILDDASVMDSATDMLSSIANVKPMSMVARKNARGIAKNRGDGWSQAYAASIAASQLLMLIEYATFNMQSAIGNGVAFKTDDGATNVAENTGGSVSLGNGSGTVTNANGYPIVSYRGEENLWGNIWYWVDGMNEQNPATIVDGEYGTLFVADHDFADDTATSPYENTGIHPCCGSGSVSAFGYAEKYDWMFVPAEKGGTSVLPVGDYYGNTNPSWRIARLGGRWDNAVGAGAFYWDFYHPASGYGREVGARLVFVPSRLEG